MNGPSIVILVFAHVARFHSNRPVTGGQRLSMMQTAESSAPRTIPSLTISTAT